MPLITQGLRPDLKAACSKESAVLLKRKQKFLECTHSEEPAAFLKPELASRQDLRPSRPRGHKRLGLTGFTKTLQEGANRPVRLIRDRSVHLLLTAFILP